MHLYIYIYKIKELAYVFLLSVMIFDTSDLMAHVVWYIENMK